MEADTVTVRVKFMGDLLALVGRGDLTLTLPRGSTVTDLLRSLSNSYGERFANEVFNAAGGLLPNLVIFADGKNIKALEGLDTAISNVEMEIVVLPIFEGG